MSRKYKRTSQPVEDQPIRRTNRAHKAAQAQAARRAKRSARVVWAIALLAVAVLAGGYLIVRIANNVSPWEYSEEISVEDTQRMMGKGAQIVDVRTYAEFIQAHISTSLLMPIEELPTLMQALPRDKLIILVCRSGVRSIQARYILQEAGFTQVASMTGGMQAWIAAGFPTVSGESAPHD